MLKAQIVFEQFRKREETVVSRGEIGVRLVELSDGGLDLFGCPGTCPDRAYRGCSFVGLQRKSALFEAPGG